MKYLNVEIENYLADANEQLKHFYDLKYFNGMLSGAIKNLGLRIFILDSLLGIGLMACDS